MNNVNECCENCDFIYTRKVPDECPKKYILSENNEEMDFPETWEEFERVYGFVDKEEVYTNGSRLIQSFRVKQWLDHIIGE